MALTESKLKDLQEKGFDGLFDDHVTVWTERAAVAFDHAQNYISSTDDPRPDDIAQVLIPMLEVDDTLRDYQNNNGAKAKRWVQCFAEYIIDRIYTNPGGGA